jgi:hypothetical protein
MCYFDKFEYICRKNSDVIKLQGQREFLRAGVEGPCLHRLENWLVRQLNDESKPVYKVGFIREKGKATARVLQQIPEASSLLHK